MATLLTIKDCADELGCSELSVKRLIARGRLSAVDLGEVAGSCPPS